MGEIVNHGGASTELGEKERVLQPVSGPAKISLWREFVDNYDPLPPSRS